MVLRFLRDHTASRRAYIVVDPANTASMAVATAVGASADETVTGADGRRLLRHGIDV